MVRLLLPKALRPGDVLLGHGTGPMAWAIAFLDDAPVSHAALYVGEGWVAEAVAAGVRWRRLRSSVAKSERVLVRRYPGTMDFGPVCARARRIARGGERYAYEQIVLLAFLVLTRRVPLAPSRARFLRAVLDRGAQRLASLLGAGREPMICSELVYRSFVETPAGTAGGFVLEIGRRRTRTARGGTRPPRAAPLSPSRRSPRWPTPGAALGPARTPSLTPALAAYRSDIGRSRPGPRSQANVDPRVLVSAWRCLALFEEGTRAAEAVRPAPAATGTPDKAAPQASTLTVPDFVTPGDLWRTPSLRTAGALDLGALRAIPGRTASRGSRSSRSRRARDGNTGS